MAAPTQIAYRYAKALIDLAKEANKLDVIKNDIDLFNDAVKHRELALLLKSPIVNKEKKLNILKALFGDKMDEMTMAFFNLLTKKSREEGLVEIGKSFIEQYNIINAITSVVLTTAGDMEESFMTSVTEKLNANGINGTINIEKIIDPSIIGGFILQIGDQLFDSSVKRKMELIKKELIG